MLKAYPVQFNLTKDLLVGAGEMDGSVVKNTVALAENSDSVLSIHMEANNRHNCSSGESDTLFCILWALHSYTSKLK